MKRFNWSVIKAGTGAPELNALGVQSVELKDRLYPNGQLRQFSPNEYAITFVGESGERRISQIIWAASSVCFRGVILRSPGTEDIGRTDIPTELLLGPGLGKFEDILIAARSGSYGQFNALAYGCSAMLNERGFLIQVRHFDYYFSAGMDDWTGESPVVITWHASDYRWEPLVSNLPLRDRGSESKKENGP